MSKTYYVQNTYSSDICINLKKNGRFSKSMVFARYLMDRATGQIVSDGYTEISQEDYDDLCQSGAFNLLVKNKKLILKEEAPLKAGSFEQLMDLKAHVKALEAENAELKAKLAEYEEVGSKINDGLDKMKLDELKAKAKELGADAENFTKKADVIDLIREKMTEGAE